MERTEKNNPIVGRKRARTDTVRKYIAAAAALG
jgi:hypothetical protein